MLGEFRAGSDPLWFSDDQRRLSERVTFDLGGRLTISHVGGIFLETLAPGWGDRQLVPVPVSRRKSQQSSQNSATMSLVFGWTKKVRWSPIGVLADVLVSTAHDL